jgi:radical SAM superfamily enzyme YgiQ (UPF0313 family)
VKNILLVSPLRNYHTFNEMYPSGALLLLGTMLKQQGHNVKVVHMVADKMDTSGYISELRVFRPDIVGFTVSTYQTRWTRILLRETRRLLGDKVLTVAGGPHPAAMGVNFFKDFPDTDIVVGSEGEKAITSIARGTSLDRIKGIHYIKDNTVVLSNRPETLLTPEELNALPLPDKNLIVFGRYSGLFPVGRRPAMFLPSSRGCPFLCNFCSKAIYGNTLRLRSPESVITEIESLYRDWRVKEIHLTDDTFNANLDWAHRLLDLIIAEGYHKKLIFRIAMRVNEKIVNMELLKHLKAAGIWFIYYGVESGNQGMLDRMRKGITLPEIRRAFKLTHEAGIKTEAFFIIGLPGETAGTIQDSYKLYKEIKPFWGGFSKAIPFPGTDFTAEAGSLGHIECKSYDDLTPSVMAVRTASLTSEELEKWYVIMNNMTRHGKIMHPKQMAYALWDRITIGGSI